MEWRSVRARASQYHMTKNFWNIFSVPLSPRAKNLLIPLTNCSIHLKKP